MTLKSSATSVEDFEMLSYTVTTPILSSTIDDKLNNFIEKFIPHICG